MEGGALVLNDIGSWLRHSTGQKDEVIRGIEVLTGLNGLKNNVCATSEKCQNWLENNKNYFYWDETAKYILNIAEIFCQPQAYFARYFPLTPGC